MMLDQQGIAERYDIVIDFSKFTMGSKLHLVNCCEHQDGKLPAADLTVGAGDLGRVARSVRRPLPRVPRGAAAAGWLPGQELRAGLLGNLPASTVVPTSQWPMSPFMIPNPDHSQLPVSAERTFEFNRGANAATSGPTSGEGPWGISVNSGGTLAADYGRISAAPKMGTREIWHLNNGGGGWDHPIHIHFEEGQILERDGNISNVPMAERGRKDVYRLRAAGRLSISLQFRDFSGTYMEHCHNTVHEDNAMLLRWDINGNGTAELNPMPSPVPTPQGCTFIDPSTE